MNAVATSEVDFIADNGGGGSDSDSNSDDSTGYYQPISTVDGGEDEDLSNENGEEIEDRLPNGYAFVENGVSSFDLSDEEEEVEEERMREIAMERALREDERRRNAPLTAETAGRVMEAMRGVSFGGSIPDWAGRVPEGQWIHLLRSRSAAVESSSPIHRGS